MVPVADAATAAALSRDEAAIAGAAITASPSPTSRGRRARW
jgi:hypothetical protein